MRAIVIAIGHELTSGQVLDTNSPYLAGLLAERGIETIAHWVLPDDRRAIAEAFSRAAGLAEFIIVTGGLGPTADDLTRQGLTDALGADLVLDEPSLVRLEDFFRSRGRTMVPANRIQAMFPAGSRPIENPHGTAPGIAARLGQAAVYIMPGVPYEMKWMFENRVLPDLPSRGGAIIHRMVHAFGTGESDIGSRIEDLMRRGANPTVGTTVSAGLITVRVTARGADRTEAESLAAAAVAEVRRRLGGLVVGEGDQALASAVGETLRARGQTLATAESCTGGLVGQMITEVPGSSDYYLGGIVGYANRVKQDHLGVPGEMLSRHGAVSDAVAGAMAEGCRQRFDSDWAIAITGIAGPGGGTPDKPVGLVFTAVCGAAGAAGAEVNRHLFLGDRPTVRMRAALAALNQLRLSLLKRQV